MAGRPDLAAPCVIDVHLIGYTADLDHLVLDLDAEGGGRYRLVLDADLLATLIEIDESRVDAGREPIFGLAGAVVDADAEDYEDEYAEVDEGDGYEDDGYEDEEYEDEEYGEVDEDAGYEDEEYEEEYAEVDEGEDDEGGWDEELDLIADEVDELDAEDVPGFLEDVDGEEPGHIGDGGAGSVSVIVLDPEDVPDSLRNGRGPSEPKEGPGPDERVAARAASRERIARRDEARPEPDPEPVPEPPRRSGAGSALTPAQIQAQLRAGRSARTVAKEAGTDIAWIERWLAPILEERAGILERAHALRLERPRLGRSRDPIGEAVRKSLRNRGVQPDDMAWEVARRNDGRWKVAVRYVHRGKNRVASFTYDSRRDSITPASDLARELGWTRPPSGGKRSSGSRAKKSTAKKSTAKKSAAKKSTAKKSTAKKSTSPRAR